jgi:hypothetical protein
MKSVRVVAAPTAIHDQDDGLILVSDTNACNSYPLCVIVVVPLQSEKYVRWRQQIWEQI